MSVFLVAATACSHKSPFAVEVPGEPQIFSNWLPALLNDQTAAQPSHEIMQFMDNPATYQRGPALEAILTRLGNSPNVYRATAAGYVPGDEPILHAIETYINQMILFQASQFHYLPNRTSLEKDTG